MTEEPIVIFGGAISDEGTPGAIDGLCGLSMIATVEVASEYAVDSIVMAGPPGKRV